MTAPRSIRKILKQPRTPDEERAAAEHIARECERIQAGWSDAEKLTRAGVSPVVVQVLRSCYADCAG